MLIMPAKATIKTRKPKPLPPGQRLLRVIALSCFATAFLGSFIPAGISQYTACAPQTMVSAIRLNNEIKELKQALALSAKKPRLHAGVFVFVPDSGSYVNVDARKSFPAASMIKVPVLVKLLIAMDRGDVLPDEIFELRKDLIGGGSGYLQWRPVGSKISLKEAMESMIIVSDNTATNLIIDRLGGMDACNLDFADWGLSQTYLNSWLPDLSGTNKTSPYDLSQLLARVDKGELLSPESRLLMLSIMERTKTRTLLPMGLAPGSKISHKTGDIGSLVGDTGIVTTPEGRRYIVTVQVERPFNDRRANELIRNLAQLIDQGLRQKTPVFVAKSQTTKSQM